MAELRPDRLIALREAKGFSQAALAREIHVGTTTINRLESGGTRNPREVLALAKTLDCSPAFLLGESDERGGTGSAVNSSSKPRHLRRNPDIVDVAEIDLSYGLGATYLEGPVSIETRQFSRTWLRNFTASPPERLFWTKGVGDSMEPTIRSGEMILIDRSEDTPRTNDAIWAIAMGEIGMIKRLHVRAVGKIELLSDNDRVPPIAVGQDELHIVGRVIAVVRNL